MLISRIPSGSVERATTRVLRVTVGKARAWTCFAELSGRTERKLISMRSFGVPGFGRRGYGFASLESSFNPTIPARISMKQRRRKSQF